ncbi:MAG TPA: hypothetical protein VEB39_02305, partial [Sphingomicrobium sp.]|nr:hypothetical protein [Sphingomicrobium sp.]
MTDPKQEPEKKSGNTWWIAGAALFLGYYLGQSEKPAGSGTAYAEAPAPIITPAEESTTDYAAANDALEAAADAVESAGEAVEEVADAGDYAEPDSDQAKYHTAYADAPTTAYAEASDVEDGTAEPGADAVAVETVAIATTGPWTRYQS